MSKFRYSAMRSFSRLRKAVDVGLRTEQAALLGTPPCEAHRVLGLELRHLLGDLEQCSRAAAVVVDAGARLHRVEVRAGHDDVVVVRAGQLRDDVLLRARLGQRRPTTRAVEPACASAAPCSKLAPTTGMSSGVGLPPKSVPTIRRPGRRSVLPWLKMMTRLGAGRLRVQRLDAELARAALDERDVCPPDEPGEVGGLAAAGDRVARRVEQDVDGDHVARDVAVAAAGERRRSGSRRCDRGRSA